MSEIHPALQPGNVAVITGGASGIGLAVAHRLDAMGLKLCLVDRDEAALKTAADALGNAMICALDVADRDQITRLAENVGKRLGPVSLLMNNAGTGGGGDALSNPDGWTEVLGTNLLGVLHGVQAFVPAMADSGLPGLVINTGSKQGITQPPGDTAYNVSKAGVKALTEGLAHTLRNRADCRVTAHLLVPGFTFTGMMQRRIKAMPPAAWAPDQVASRLFEGLAQGEFYILCEDNETTRAQDERRILWATQDIIANRPALSRWHPDWKDAFDSFMQA